jgi:hypothetical protein
MPSILRLSPVAFRAPITRSFGASRTFYASASRAVGKESALRTFAAVVAHNVALQDKQSTRLTNVISRADNEARPEEAEKLKQQQLKEQQQGKGQWHEGLASDSESAVKADRGDQDHSQKSIEELQKETAKAAQQERK